MLDSGLEPINQLIVMHVDIVNYEYRNKSYNNQDDELIALLIA
jgi:hypothetical protein